MNFMFNWIEALKAIEIDFENEGQGGCCEYIDKIYGIQEFLWQANRSKIEITWFDSEPFCICGNGIGDVDCDCEWDWFLETEPKRKIFTKRQYFDYHQPVLF